MQEIQGKLWQLTNNLDMSESKSKEYMEICTEHKLTTLNIADLDEKCTVPLIENFGMIDFYENNTPRHIRMRNQLNEMREVSDFDQSSLSDSFSRSNSSPPVGKTESFFPQSRNIELPKQLMTKGFSQLSGTSDESKPSSPDSKEKQSLGRTKLVSLVTTNKDRISIPEVNIRKITESSYNTGIQRHRTTLRKKNIQEDTSQQKQKIFENKIHSVQQESNQSTYRHQQIKDRYYSSSSNLKITRSLQKQNNILKISNQEGQTIQSLYGASQESRKVFKSQLIKISSLANSTKTTDSPTLSIQSFKQLNSPHTLVSPQLKKERVSKFKKLFQYDSSLQTNPKRYLNKNQSSKIS